MLFFVKAAVSTGLLWFLVNLLQKDELGASLERIPLSAVAAASVLLTLQGPILALRWHQVLRVFGTRVPLSQLVGMSFIGLFFNQAMPTSIGGDAIRMWQLHRTGIPAQISITSVLNERLSGLLILLLLVTVGTPSIWLVLDTPESRFLWSAIVLLTLFGFTVFLLIDRLPERVAAAFRATKITELSADFKRLLHAGRMTASLVLLGLLSWAVAIAAVVILSLGLGITVAPGYYAIIVPMVILMMIVPISIGGWGVREGAFIFLLGHLGVSSAESFLLSVLFGLTLILASLPGIVFWLLEPPLKTRDEQDMKYD